jgi:hypothetical protein
MFRRDRERTLLKLIESQERRIDRLENKLMYLCDRPWELPQGGGQAETYEEPEVPDFGIPELEAVDEAV